MATKSKLRGASLATLATNIDGAVVALCRVAEHMHCVEAERVVVAAVLELEGLKAELDVVRSEVARDARMANWSLDRGWHPAAFGVATHRPRILLTIASNALRAISELYDQVLDEPWPDTIETVLERHRNRITELESDLVKLRRDNNCP